MIFYAKDFSILPDSETAKKLDTVFSEMAKTGDKKQQNYLFKKEKSLCKGSKLQKSCD